MLSQITLAIRNNQDTEEQIDALAAICQTQPAHWSEYVALIADSELDVTIRKKLAIRIIHIASDELDAELVKSFSSISDEVMECFRYKVPSLKLDVQLVIDRALATNHEIIIETMMSFLGNNLENEISMNFLMRALFDREFDEILRGRALAELGRTKCKMLVNIAFGVLTMKHASVYMIDSACESLSHQYGESREIVQRLLKMAEDTELPKNLRAAIISSLDMECAQNIVPRLSIQCFWKITESDLHEEVVQASSQAIFELAEHHQLTELESVKKGMMMLFSNREDDLFRRLAIVEALMSQLSDPQVLGLLIQHMHDPTEEDTVRERIVTEIVFFVGDGQSELDKKINEAIANIPEDSYTADSLLAEAIKSAKNGF